MANRVAIPILGGTLAPYSSSAPPPFVFSQNTISETWHLNQEQIQRAVDVPASIQTTYPNAKSLVDIKYVKANHFNSVSVYSSLTAAAIDGLTG